MKWIFVGLVVLGFSAAAHCQTAISGTFKYPDGTVLNGRVEISLKRNAVKNLCSSPVNVVSFQTVKVLVTAGTLGSLSLYATSCLTPQQPYTVKVFDSRNTMLYQASWTVPNTGSANVVQLDTQ